jgi:DNA invertase Pin-like site-specific DNA recombinase
VPEEIVPSAKPAAAQVLGLDGLESRKGTQGYFSISVFNKPALSEGSAIMVREVPKPLQKLLQQSRGFNNLPTPFFARIEGVTTSLELPDDLLSAFPAARTEILIGYARVSTRGQNLERQHDMLNAAGCRRIFSDKKSGKNADRPELKACHAFLQSGDTLVVPELARYGRSLQDLITMVGELRNREIGFTSLHENLDTTTPGGRLVFHVFAALAEFIRELIVAGTHEGLAAAKARGRTGGRPSVVNDDILRAARDMLPNPAHSVTSIAKLLGVSVGTLYNHIPDLQELRAAGADAAALTASRES